MAKRPRAQEAPADWKPTQAVPEPILNPPYVEPTRHWLYKDGIPEAVGSRRPASYYYTSKKVGTRQQDLLAEEERDDLELVNRLRKDVKRWREVKYRGASAVTRDLLAHWTREDRDRRLFFCQVEAIESLIYLLELGIPGRLAATGYKTFEVDTALLSVLLEGNRPDFSTEGDVLYPRLIDPSGKPDEVALRRLGCKMATGSGKTAVMAMLITWAFLNRARNPASTQFPNGVLVCAPNLTVRQRLQVLQPSDPYNSYDYFDLVPGKYRDQLNSGKILITNWHAFAPKSEHSEGDATYRVVQKGEETADAFSKDRLGDLTARLPILVLNDEGHHCWRPNPAGPSEEALNALTKEERDRLEADKEEARVWLSGLDRINNCGLIGKDEAGRWRAGILACVDLSATPFYLGNSGYPEGSPFPWLVSDFGLVDAIECGIVKIPRLPVADDKAKADEAGRPDPQYFRLWKHIIDDKLQPNEKIAGRPKPDAIYRHAEGALKTLAAQWKIRFDKIKKDSAAGDFIPPVMIVVCDNTDIADVFYQRISGERPLDVADDSEEGVQVEKVVYSDSDIFPELRNEPGLKRTVRIDSKRLEKIETEEGETKDEAGKALRDVIASIGKRGGPGEQVRCIVSVSMLTEGWDANNVTHVLGVRAFLSQLLCEQVVGRGLRRMNYRVDPKTGLLPAEYVDVYGIPFSLIPFKGRPPEDQPDDPVYHRIFSVPERASLELRFPVVESYTYDVRESGIQCDIDRLAELEVTEEPTTVWLTPTRGYNDDPNALGSGDLVKQTREEYYKTVRPQQVIFRIAQLIVEDLVAGASGPGAQAAKARGLARHQVFPEIVNILQKYVARKIRFGPGVDIRELALERYAQQVRERVRDGITAAVASKDFPLLPVLNRFQPFGTTAGVEDQTTRPTMRLTRSHLNAAIVHSEDERLAIDVLEELDCVDCFSPNSRRIGMTIPYRYNDAGLRYEPDFVVRLRGGKMLVLEIKGIAGIIHDPNQITAKNAAAAKWIEAVNNAKRYGQWAFVYCDQAAALRSMILAHVHVEPGTGNALPFQHVTPKLGEHFKTCVPLTTLRAAAGKFSEEQMGFDELVAWAQEWITWDGHPQFEEGMFVARVQGKSMEPDIPDGSYCLFRPPHPGSRQGRHVLVWHSGISDPLTGGHYTLKVYTSEKAVSGDDTWRHVRVVLKPINADFEEITLTPSDEDDVRVIGEFVSVLGSR